MATGQMIPCSLPSTVLGLAAAQRWPGVGAKGQEEEEWEPPGPPLLLFWGQFWDWGTRGGKRDSLSHLPPHCHVYQYDLIGKSVALRCEELNNKFDCEKEPWGAEVPIEGHPKGKQHRGRNVSREEVLMGWEGRRGAGRSSDWRERQKVRACADQLVGRAADCCRILCCADRIFSVRGKWGHLVRESSRWTVREGVL